MTQQVHLPVVIAIHFDMSRSEARRLIAQGAVKIAGEIVTDTDVPENRLEGVSLSVNDRAHNFR